MDNMNYLDVVLGGIVILSALIGIARGLLKEVLSLIAWAVAIYVAWRFAEPVAEQYVTRFIDDTMISYLAAFGLLFLLTLFVVGLFNLIVTQLVSSTGLSGFDRFLGMVFGFARGLLISTLLVLVLSLTPLKKEGWWAASKLAPEFESIGEWGWARLPANIRKLLRQDGASFADAGTPLGATYTPSTANEASERISADRPDVSPPSEQRNAISGMSASELQLESLSNEFSAGQQGGTPSSDSSAATANQSAEQGESEVILPVAPLQLDSLQ